MTPRLKQADIARETGLSEMTISRAVAQLCRRGVPLDDDTALLLLVADELTRLSLAWPLAVQLVAKFSDAVRFLAFDPTTRQNWIVFVDSTDEAPAFQMAAVSKAHLSAILDAHPLSLTLALHRPVEEALDRMRSLKAHKHAVAA